MKKEVKVSKFGCIISSIGILIAITAMFVSDFKAYTVTIFFCSISIFCANLANYQKYKKKDDGNKL